MCCYGGLAVIEGLLLAVKALVLVLEVVFGEGGPGGVVAALGPPGSRAGEEELIAPSLLHPSPAHRVSLEVLLSLAAEREGDGWKKVKGW